MEKKQNVPALRFPGFSGEWNTHTLESMCDVFTDGDWIEANDQSNVGIRLIQTGNIGVTEYTDKPKHKKWISKETFDRLHCTAVLPGDILISRLPEPAGRACVIPDLGMEMITAVDCTIARVAEAYSKEYLVQYLSTAKYFSEVRDCLAGGTRQRISRGNLSIFTIPVPADKTEQDKIGDFFEWLDNCIAVKKQKIQKLQQFRQAMLTKLFPWEGAAEPELRFRGFSGKWKRCKLGDVATFINGRAYTRDELLSTGKYKVLRVGNFYTNDKWYYSNLELGEKYYAHKGDLLYTWSATFGPHIWDGDTVIYHYHIWKVELSEYLDKLFALQLLELDRDALLSDTNGSTMIHITMSDMKNRWITISENIEEQKLIGLFFYHLNLFISLQQKKLERMQRLKAALLEKLFV